MTARRLTGVRPARLSRFSILGIVRNFFLVVCGLLVLPLLLLMILVDWLPDDGRLRDL